MWQSVEENMESQRENATGLWIKFAKAGSGIASVTKAEAIA
jgi:hypothetical protein